MLLFIYLEISLIGKFLKILILCLMRNKKFYHVINKYKINFLRTSKNIKSGIMIVIL